MAVKFLADGTGGADLMAGTSGCFRLAPQTLNSSVAWMDP
jgi:hypothetical protein